MDLGGTALRLLETCERDEQAVEPVEDDGDAEGIRDRVRRLARQRGLRIRTARLPGTIAVVRLDAAVWHEDAATMRAKLAPGGGPPATGR